MTAPSDWIVEEDHQSQAQCCWGGLSLKSQGHTRLALRHNTRHGAELLELELSFFYINVCMYFVFFLAFPPSIITILAFKLLKLFYFILFDVY